MVALDASSPAITTNTVGTVADLASPSFTPPDGSLLLVAWVGNSQGNSVPTTPGITDSLGSPLTYSPVGWCSRSDAPACDGQAAMWTAPVGTAAAMTVTVTNNDPDATHKQAALKVWVLTGTELDNPVGASGKAASTSVTTVTQNYTASGTGQGFIVISDWNARGAQTAGTGCTLTGGGSANVTTAFTYAFVLRAAADDAPGATTTLSSTLPAASQTVHYVYAAITDPIEPAWPARSPWEKQHRWYQRR